MSPFDDDFGDLDLEDDEDLEEDADDDDDDGLDEAPDAYDGPRCVKCGCSEDNPCEGGCIWASPFLCSRCA